MKENYVTPEVIIDIIKTSDVLWTSGSITENEFEDIYDKEI